MSKIRVYADIEIDPVNLSEDMDVILKSASTEDLIDEIQHREWMVHKYCA